MDQSNDTKPMMNGDKSMTCGGMCHRGGKKGMMYLIKVLITVIILFIVFWSGVRVGAMRGEGGRGTMMQGNMMYNRGGRMMGQGGMMGGMPGGMMKTNTAPTTPPTSTTPVTTPTTK